MHKPSFSKNLLVGFIFLVFLSQNAYSQVAIGTSGTPTPDANAVLLLVGNGSQGLIIPTVTTLGAFGKAGMVVYNSSTKFVYYHDGSAWNQVGGASAGGQGITISGNTVQLNSTPGATFGLSNTAPTGKGQLLVWDGTKWDATTAPTTSGQTLTWDNTNGRWILGTSSAATLSGDVTGPATATAIAATSGNNIVSAINNAATTSKITPSQITPGTNNQVLTTNGGIATWSSLSSLPVLSANQLLSNNGSNTGITVAGDLTLSVSGTTGTFTIGNNAVTNTKLATGIDAAKITTGTLPVAQVPGLDAAKITTGVLPVGLGGTGASNLSGVLVGNGSSAFTAITTGSNGQVLTVNAGVPSWQNAPTASGAAGGDLTGTYPNPTLALGSVTSTKLATNAVATANIAAGAVDDSKIANVAPSKILQSSATNGQILKWNGTVWAPAADNVGGGGAPTLNPGQIIVGDGSTNSAATISQDAVLNSTNGNITVQGLQGRPIASTVPATNSVYQYNGTQWTPVVLSGGGTVTNVATGTGLTGGPISSTGTISIAASGVTATELAANAVTNAKIAANAVNTSQIIDGTITDTDVSASAAIAVNKLATGTNGQVLTVSGGVPTWQTSSALTNPMTTTGDLIAGGPAGVPGRLGIGTNGQVLTVNAGIPSWQNAPAPSGAAGGDLAGTFPNPTIASGAGTNIITAINGAASLINGARINTSFGAQNISTTGTLTSGAITATNLASINGATYSWPNSNAAGVLTNNGSGTLTWAPSTGLSTSLTSANIFVGNSGNIATGVAMSGDATISNTGAVTIGTGAITSTKILDGTIANADINAAAAIAGTKVAPAFGTQNISTTGTLTTGPATVSGLTIGTSVWPANATGVLTNNGTGTLTWGSSLTNPMTAAGDVIYGGVGGTPTRLATGSGFLKGGATPTYSAVDISTADVTGTLPITSGGTGATTAATARTSLGLGSLSTLSTVTTTEITDGTITDVDVNASAAIAGSKINPAFGAQNVSTTGTLAAGATTVSGLTVSGATTLNTVGYTWPATQGAAGTVLTNNGTGTLTWTTPAGLSSTLTSANIFVGNGSNVATGVPLSGDATITNAGVLTLSTVAATGNRMITALNNSSVGSINGSKINANFGAGNISTTGTLVVSGATSLSNASLQIGVVPYTWPAAQGTAGTVLTNNGTGTLTWGPSFTNPMTTPGDIIYGGASGAPTRLATGTGFLKGGATPSYSAVDLTGSDVSGTLNVTNGGTGRAIWNGVLYGSGATLSDITPGPAGTIFTSLGPATAPTWSAPITATTANTVIRGDAAGTAQVASSITDDGTRVTINGALNPSYRFLAYGSNEALAIDNSGNIIIGDVLGNSNSNYFFTDFEGTPRFAFMGANTGFGTLNPAYPVDIRTPLGSSAYGLNHSDGDITVSTYVGNGGVTGGSIGTQSNHPFFIYTNNGGAKLTVMPSGFVGIGSTAPSHKLTLFENSGFVLTNYQNGTTGTSSADGFMVGLDDVAGNVDIWNWEATDMKIGTSGSERMRITSGGNVGIGTSNPARPLEVNNAMKFTNSSADPNDGVIGTATFAAGLNIVGIDTDATGRKINSWGSLIQNENLAGNSFIGNTFFNGDPGATLPMIYMFKSGSSNPNKMVIAHSPAFSNYGLQYTDSNDVFNFLGNGSVRMSVNLASGAVNVPGTLTKGSGTFKIDHPQDPENKYLYHSFVESPDMMNVYNGNIVTDATGVAIVSLPEYFESLNKDFRYQLTVIGEFAQAIVFKKIANNQFQIKTDKPNIEVSWQVTGIRKDPFAEKNRIVPEVEKTGSEKGKYLHPEAYGLPLDKGVNYVPPKENNN